MSNAFAITQTLTVASNRGRSSYGPDGFFDGEVFDPKDQTWHCKPSE